MPSRFASLVAASALGVLAVAPAAADAPGRDLGVTYQVKELIQGAQIHGANGLALDADGQLVVASVWGGELVVVDPRTGAIRDRLGHEVGVDGPDDVALGPDGSLYWTDILTGEVGRLSPEGTTTKQFVAEWVNPIAFTDDGRLFVGSALFADGLFELDPALIDAPRVVIPPSGSPPLNGFDFGPDGMLYAPQPDLARIVRVNPETGDVAVIADLPESSTSVEFDSSGTLFAGLGDGRIVTVDTDDGSLETVATIPVGPDNMVFDEAGRLYASGGDDGSIHVVAQGRGVRTLVRGGLIMPGGVAVMPRSGESESLFVADLWTLAEFDARSGRLIDVDGDGIIEPWTAAPDGDHVILTSFLSNAVQVWDPRDNTAAATYEGFAAPLNALRFQGDLVVAELGTGSVVRQDAGGTRTTIADSATLPPPGLFVPSGLAAMGDDLWVADWATGIIWKIAGEGAPRIVTGGLAAPEGMAVDHDGSLLVVESGAGRLSRVDPITGAVSAVVDGLAMDVAGPQGLPPTFAMSSVAVDSHGTMLVSGAGAERSVVYRIKELPAR